MEPDMIHILFGVFLILHGLVHAGLAAAPIPNEPNSKPGAFFTDVTRSWLLSGMKLNASTVRVTGILLVALPTLGFVVAGLGVLGISGLESIWRMTAVISSGLSLLVLIVFWHPWLLVGSLINVGMIISLLWAHWPSPGLIGS
jgi:hypothetical protein